MKKSNIISITDPNTGEKVSYYISPRMERNLKDKIIPSLNINDKDCFFIIDGAEGSGKSTFAMQIGKRVDPTLNLSRIVFSPDDFRDAILKAKKGQCIIYDEAFTGFSSRSSLSPVNKVLVSLAMQMRQKNLFILIVLPSIFLLDKYIAMHRAKALIHIYENKGIRGYYRVYNGEKKKRLILEGKKAMTYRIKNLHVKFKGRFYGKFALGDEECEKKYLLMKEKALEDSEKTSMTSAQVRFKEQRDLMMWLFKGYTTLTYLQMENLLEEYDFSISFQQISKICNKFGRITPKVVKNWEEVAKKDDIKANKEETSPIEGIEQELPVLEGERAVLEGID